MLVNDMSRADLEVIMLENDELYTKYEDRLMNEEMSTEEMREIIIAWIEAGDECSGC